MLPGIYLQAFVGVNAHFKAKKYAFLVTLKRNAESWLRRVEMEFYIFIVTTSGLLRPGHYLTEP